MKNLLTTILMTFLFLPSYTGAAEMTESEKHKEPATKIEAFLSKKGEILIKNFYELGSHFYPGNITLDAIVIYKPGQEGQKTKGMRIDVEESGTLGRSNSAFLDIDEVESLQKALLYLEGLAEKWTNTEFENTAEVVYSTKGNFSVGFFKGKDKTKGFASCGFIGRTTVFFPVDEIKTVRASVEKGLKILKEKQ